MNRNYFEIEEVNIYEEIIEIYTEDRFVRESIREYYEERYEGSFEMKSCGYCYDWDFAA